MRFGIAFGSYQSDLNRADICRDFTERARVAQASNYEALFVAHHYSAGPDAAMLQSLPLLSYFAGVAPGMYLGTAIFLLPMHEPLMVAEYTATQPEGGGRPDTRGLRAALRTLPALGPAGRALRPAVRAVAAGPPRPRQPGGGDRAGAVLPRGVRRRDDVVHGRLARYGPPNHP